MSTNDFLKSISHLPIIYLNHVNISWERAYVKDKIKTNF
jgi:hypothetical protein